MIATAKVDEIKKDLTTHIEELIHRGFQYFYCGGARGYDLLAGFAVVELREKYPHIQLHMVLPCFNPTKNWNEQNRKNYHQLMDAADTRTFVTVWYDDTCMLRRNQYLVDHSAVCLAYLNHMRSGTAQTVRLAKEQGLEVINLAEN